MTNPFLQPQQPAAQPQQAPPANNPYAQPQQPAAPAGGNPFGPGVPAQQPQQPAYAPPAPQGYASQQQPAYAPPAQQAPQQQAPQQQAPQQQAYAQPAQQAAPPPLTGGIQSVGAPVVGEGRGARLAHMYGRLVLVFPLSIVTRPRNEKYITPEQRARGDINQEQLTATFVVLDDGNGGMNPIWFGGDPTAFPPKPDTESAPLPYVRPSLWVTQTRLIGQLREALPAGPGAAPQMRLGRVVKAGPESNAAWYLETATQADLDLANKYLELVQSGTYPHPLA